MCGLPSEEEQATTYNNSSKHTIQQQRMHRALHPKVGANGGKQGLPSNARGMQQLHHNYTTEEKNALHLWVVHNVAICALKVGACLVHRQLGKHVAVVVGTALIREDVRH